MSLFIVSIVVVLISFQGRINTLGGPMPKSYGGPCVCGAEGAKRPSERPEAASGGGCGRGSPPLAMGVRGYNPGKSLKIQMLVGEFLVHFWSKIKQFNLSTFLLTVYNL